MRIGIVFAKTNSRRDVGPLGNGLTILAGDLAEIIRGLLKQETYCRTLTRRASEGEL